MSLMPPPAVAPMRIARGIQNKVLEAMSLARPVVLTSGALEGIAAMPGREVVLADTAPAFAAACVRLAQRAAIVTAIGHAARACILRRYDWMLRCAVSMIYCTRNRWRRFAETP